MFRGATHTHYHTSVCHAMFVSIWHKGGAGRTARLEKTKSSTVERQVLTTVLPHRVTASHPSRRARHTDKVAGRRGLFPGGLGAHHTGTTHATRRASTNQRVHHGRLARRVHNKGSASRPHTPRFFRQVPFFSETMPSFAEVPRVGGDRLGDVAWQAGARVLEPGWQVVFHDCRSGPAFSCVDKRC